MKSPVQEPAEESGLRDAMFFWGIVGGAAVVILVAFPLLDSLYGFNAYRKFIENPWIAPIAVPVGIPVGVFCAMRFHSQGRRVLPTVLWVVVIVLAGVANVAIRNAREYHFHNCWTIRKYEDAGSRGEVIECTPSGSTPEQYSGYNANAEEGESKYCRQTSTSSSGGTIWRCVTVRY